MRNDVRMKALVTAIGLVLSGGALASTTYQVRQSTTLAPSASLTAPLGLGTDAALVARPDSTVTTVRGTRVVREQQTYQGVPVFGRSVAVERDNAGNTVGVSGVVEQGLPADLASVTPQLSAAQAVAMLKQHAGTLATGGAIRNVQATLYVYPQQGAAARLVYLTSYFVASPSSAATAISS